MSDPKDPWDVAPSRTPGNQPLPKLEDLGRWVLETVRPVVAPVLGQLLFRWDAGKLDDVKAEFIPKTEEGEMGCMKAAAAAKGQSLTAREIHFRTIDSFTSPWNSADHLFNLMLDKGMAGQMLDARNADADKSIRDMTGDAPGVYFYGMAVRDNHTVTLAVERGTDGSQKMYWLDQNSPNGRVIEAGKLGEALDSVPGHTPRTHIWAFKPGSN
jgi:hypothetical protein